MKRSSRVEALRTQLAVLIAKPGPVGQRGRELWSIAEQIADATGEPVKRVFERGARDAAERLRAEVER